MTSDGLLGRAELEQAFTVLVPGASSQSMLAPYISL